jgi:hypothetical protein
MEEFQSDHHTNCVYDEMKGGGHDTDPIPPYALQVKTGVMSTQPAGCAEKGGDMVVILPCSITVLSLRQVIGFILHSFHLQCTGVTLCYMNINEGSPPCAKLLQPGTLLDHYLQLYVFVTLPLCKLLLQTKSLTRAGPELGTPKLNGTEINKFSSLNTTPFLQQPQPRTTTFSYQLSCQQIQSWPKQVVKTGKPSSRLPACSGIVTHSCTAAAAAAAAAAHFLHLVPNTLATKKLALWSGTRQRHLLFPSHRVLFH